MLSVETLITEILQCLKEKSGLVAGEDPHWSRTVILRRCNLAQEMIEAELPGILHISDATTLTTDGSGQYTIPETFLRLTSVRVDGEFWEATSQEAVASRDIREQTESGNMWYVVDRTLYLMPDDTTGLVVTLDGTVRLSSVSDSSSSYPFDATSSTNAYLSKAQKLLILLVVLECAKEESRTDLYTTTYNEIYHPVNGLLEKLHNEWFVVRENPQESMLEIKREG